MWLHAQQETSGPVHSKAGAVFQGNASADRDINNGGLHVANLIGDVNICKFKYESDLMPSAKDENRTVLRQQIPMRINDGVSSGALTASVTSTKSDRSLSTTDEEIWPQSRRWLADISLTPELLEQYKSYIQTTYKNAIQLQQVPDIRTYQGGTKKSKVAQLWAWLTIREPLLLKAVRKGDISTAGRLIEDGTKLDSASDWRGWTPLTLAAYNGHGEMIELLLNKQAIVDSRGPFGRTPLSLAAANGHKSVAQSLIWHGAAVDSRDVYGETPLVRAVESDDTPVAELLLDNGARVDSKNSQGQTPLALAAEHGCKRLVELLLQYRAEIDLRDFKGRTALATAARCGHESVVKYLLKRGATIEARDQEGRTPLALAAMKQHISVVWTLVVNGANRHPRDKTGRTPLELSPKNYELESALNSTSGERRYRRERLRSRSSQRHSLSSDSSSRIYTMPSYCSSIA